MNHMKSVNQFLECLEPAIRAEVREKVHSKVKTIIDDESAKILAEVTAGIVNALSVKTIQTSYGGVGVEVTVKLPAPSQ